MPPKKAANKKETMTAKKLVPVAPPPLMMKKKQVAVVEDDKKKSDAGAETHKCVMCEKLMGSKQELQDHFRLHANMTIDMKGNTIKKNPPVVHQLKPTANTHNQSKAATIVTEHNTNQISCDVCPQAFATVTLAIQHKFKKHPNSNVKYFCGFCGKQFPLQICLSKHVESEHKNDKRTSKLYKCKDCPAEFFKESAIINHIRSSHKRVTALINPVTTMAPSKKIKMNNSFEQTSVYYCHLCGIYCCI